MKSLAILSNLNKDIKKSNFLATKKIKIIDSDDENEILIVDVKYDVS